MKNDTLRWHRKVATLIGLVATLNLVVSAATANAADKLADLSSVLYVAGDAQNSAQAVANLRALCRAHLPDRHEIEVVDVFREPMCALADVILMTPTLIKLAPSPVRRVVGTLSQTQPVLQALGVESLSA